METFLIIIAILIIIALFIAYNSKSKTKNQNTIGSTPDVPTETGDTTPDKPEKM